MGTRARIGRGELLRMAEDEGQVPVCDRCDRALGRDGLCLRCEAGPKLADPQLELGTRADGFHAIPLDWSALQREGLPRVEMLLPPYFARGAKVVGWGPAESMKSLYAMHASAQLSREGVRVVFVSQENPLAEDVRRLERLRPDWERLSFFHDQGFDLTEPEHIHALIEAATGAGFVVLDTLSACWSGDENENKAIAAFERDVLTPLIRATGATVFVIDHVGHPQPFMRRRGISAGRGASSKGQKFDIVLEFRPGGLGEFTIEHAKNRPGGVKEPPRTFRVVDAEDGGLELEQTIGIEEAKVAELAEVIVSAVDSAGYLNTRALRAALVGRGGVETQNAAMKLLLAEDPPRVTVGWEQVETDRGRQRAKVWRPVGGKLL